MGFRPKERKRFRPRARVTKSSVNEVEEEEEENNNEDNDLVTKLRTREPASKIQSNKVHTGSRFSVFGRRPRPGLVTPERRRAEELAVEKEEKEEKEEKKEKQEEKENTVSHRQPITLQASGTTLSPLKLEDFFGTPEPVAARELLPTREPQVLRPDLSRIPEPLLAPRIPLALGNDLGSSESLLDAVRTQTSALTGAQALEVTREVTKLGRREHARQLPLGPVLDSVQQPSLANRFSSPQETRVRGRQGGTASRRTSAAAPRNREEEIYFERGAAEDEEEGSHKTREAWEQEGQGGKHPQ